MYIITELEQTCSACPAQWSGRTQDGYPIYIRFRWGCLSIRIGPDKDGDVDDAVMGIEIFGYDSEDGMDGLMSFKELKKITKGSIKFKAKTQDSLWYRNPNIPERFMMICRMIKARWNKRNE